MRGAPFLPVITHGRGGVSILDPSVDELAIQDLSSRTTQLSYSGWESKGLIRFLSKVSGDVKRFLQLVFRQRAGVALMSGGLQRVITLK